MNNFPDFSGKKRIIFIDDVSTTFAQEYGKIYTNAVFFTNNNEIWKNGVPVANHITLDNNKSEFVGNNGVVYRLSLQDGLLSITNNDIIYWYIGISSVESKNAPSLSSVKSYQNNDYGWYFLSSENIIFANESSDKDRWKAYMYFDEQNGTKEWSDGANPLFSSSFNYGTENNQYAPQRNINFGNLRHIPAEDYGAFKIDLILPKVVVDKYNVGLYDDYALRNFLDERTYDEKNIDRILRYFTLAKENNEEAKTNPALNEYNPNLGNSPDNNISGIYYTKSEQILKYSSQEYYWYKIYVFPKAPNIEADIYFNLHLYYKKIDD
jgi:hypothetical protein